MLKFFNYKGYYLMSKENTERFLGSKANDLPTSSAPFTLILLSLNK